MPSRPYLRIDLATVRRNVAALRGALPTAEIRYAVKANPAEPVLRLLADLDCTFDVASVGEADLCTAAGIDGALMTFGNPLKKPAEVAYAFARGVRRFTFDTAAGLEAIAENAPGSSVECRIAPAFPSSVTPFGHKFGCAPDDAVGLLTEAARSGLRADGVAFHVGSQQLDPAAWEIGIRCARDIFGTVPTLTTLNLGGGIPIPYNAPVPGVEVVGAAITDALGRYFPALPHVVLEPGRAVVGSAGTLSCEVVSVRNGTDGGRWVYLDIGRYGGLAETENEYIRYRLRTSRDGDPVDDAVVAGPTCDGDDVLYRRYPLPVTLRPGDLVEIDAAGAYTTSYSSSFNGFEPLATQFVEVTDAVTTR
ncbi:MULTISPECIES: type III PLP-dependent enzyme [unclassified Mycobacterium]|uniref:type III PLP-dependent enzyme n=1 Tax=unclassified Mycobacterium TaxID=2642494 RepID=UPI00048E770D|nr:MULTISPECIES: type III PLP-dependent enzyme [unclassified Mycobacterium]SEB16762.1 ornithine decarboxylase [Mycobacterium sp. 283mftsu]